MSDPDKYIVHRVNDVAEGPEIERRTADTSRAEQVVGAWFQGSPLAASHAPPLAV